MSRRAKKTDSDSTSDAAPPAKRGSKRKAKNDDDEEEADDNSSSSKPLDGTVWVISGKLSISQSAMNSKLVKLGASVSTSYSQKVTHVVSSDINSTKAAQAAGHDKPVLTEDAVAEIESSGKIPDDSKFYLHKPGSGSGSSSSSSSSSDSAKPAKKAKTTKKKDEEEEEEEEEEDDKDKKTSAAVSPASSSSSSPSVKTVVVKGKAPVDEHCRLGTSVHVYHEGEDVWDAMLNQTNIGQNNNKFYVIQLLESDSGGQYWCWNRWGRVGAPGQNSLKSCGSNLDLAKQEFQKKFKDKTRNAWENRKNFEFVHGKYDYLEMDHGADDMEEEKAPSSSSKDEKGEEDEKPKESKLDKRVQDLVKLICNLKMMENVMKEIGYDAKKLPLGKLSKNTVQKGYLVLKEIADVLDGTADGNLTALSSRYYTLIPHVFGMRTPPTIRTHDQLKAELKMVEALADIEIATKLLKTGSNLDVHPVDANYDKLKANLVPIERSDDEFELLKKYVKNTHAKTHNSYELEIENAFKIEREGENERFEKYKDTENRQLLWHGSRLTNWVGIISQGLRIAPPEAPVTGYMFGKGVYFADMVSKSANYCFTNRNDNTGVMLLCEVALGKEACKYQADYHANILPAGCLSTKGCGTTAPDPSGFEKLDDGVIVPCGVGTNQTLPQSTSLAYNEFIVYDVAQIRCRYLLRMKFNYK